MLNGTGYSDLKTLAKDLESDYKGKNVTIQMMNNWNAAGSNGSGSAGTGDTSHVFIWSAVLASSLLVLIIAAILRRRGKQTQQN